MRVAEIFINHSILTLWKKTMTTMTSVNQAALYTTIFKITFRAPR